MFDMGGICRKESIVLCTIRYHNIILNPDSLIQIDGLLVSTHITIPIDPCGEVQARRTKSALKM